LTGRHEIVNIYISFWRLLSHEGTSPRDASAHPSATAGSCHPYGRMMVYPSAFPWSTWTECASPGTARAGWALENVNIFKVLASRPLRRPRSAVARAARSLPPYTAISPPPPCRFPRHPEEPPIEVATSSSLSYSPRRASRSCSVSCTSWHSIPPRRLPEVPGPRASSVPKEDGR
jgi:hypothetical protein